MELAIDCLKEKRLFKFRSVDRNRESRTSNIFTCNELFFASPPQLNDPWESQPQFTIENINDPNYRTRFVEHMSKIMLEEKPRDNKEEVKDWLQNLPAEQVEQYTAEQEKIVHSKWMNESRIYSLSATNSHPLLWSHYADSHSGYCLVFDASTDIFGNAMKITYLDDYPSIDILDNDNDRLLRTSILSKARFWTYEEEYRLVSMEPNIQDVLPVKNNIWHYPKELLIGVVFGCRMGKEDRDWIIKFLEEARKNVQLMEAKKNEYHYSLDIIEI